MTTETTSNWFNAGVCFRQKKSHFCFLCRRSCRWAKQHLSQDQFQPQVPPFLSQTETPQLSKWEAARFHILKSSLQHQNIYSKHFVLARDLGWRNIERKQLLTQQWKKKTAGVNYGCNVFRRIKKTWKCAKVWSLIDAVQGLFPRNREKEENNNSPHFLFVKYESAAGSLKCRLYIVSAPAWKS